MSLWLDEKSLLARIDGAMPLAEVERSLSSCGMTVDVPGAGNSSERSQALRRRRMRALPTKSPGPAGS